MTRVVHAITPGDHFSPRTGSAIPTVVHGLAKAAARDIRTPAYPQFVVLGDLTHRPRYDSAAAIEFSLVDAPTRNERVRDVALGALGLPRRAASRYFAPLASALARTEPSIVLAHNAPALPRLLRGSGHQTVLYAHNDILRSMTRYETGRALDTVGAIVCVSESLAKQTAAHVPRTLRDRIHIVGNGVDTEQFTPAPPRRPGRIGVIFVGRMIPEKGPDILLEAMALLGRDDIDLLLVGSRGFDASAPLTPYEQSLRGRAARCRGPVEFRPFVPRSELPQLLQDSDLMVVPSRWSEPSGLTVGEALATGLPVIAHRVGGIPEVLGSAGILVDPDQPAALARQIDRLASDPALRTRLSEEARQRAEAHDWSWSWSQLRAVLDAI